MAQLPRAHRPRRRVRFGRTLPALIVTAATLLAPHAAQAEPAGAPTAATEGPPGARAGYSVPDVGPPGPPRPRAGVPGVDVSGHQNRVDWRAAHAAGARFAYVKATEGTGYVSPDFGHQYNGAHAVGMIRGAYHFALPNVSTGAAQARYFVAHGGGWVPDGRTLPGAVDLEYNPYGPTCYGLSKTQMTAWIRDFSDTYETLTGRHPTIYTSTSWWNTCTGGDASFAASNPLWVARYGPDVGALPAGWAYQTVWQYNDHGRLPGDQNTFNGTVAQLRQFAA